MALFVDLK